MSHNRGDGPSDVFKAGEPTRVKVIKIDDKGKIWLSHKATIPDPWQQVAQKYAQGTKHTGKVARLQPFGAFIELESGHRRPHPPGRPLGQPHREPEPTS